MYEPQTGMKNIPRHRIYLETQAMVNNVGCCLQYITKEHMK